MPEVNRSRVGWQDRRSGGTRFRCAGGTLASFPGAAPMEELVECSSWMQNAPHAWAKHFVVEKVGKFLTDQAWEVCDLPPAPLSV
eukprot:1335584-Prymnesium_polylepis.1